VSKPKTYSSAWQDAATAIGAAALGGMEVHCPVCEKGGTALSKWVKGTAVKPLYVVHTNGDGHFKACRLGEDQAALVRSEVGITYTDVRKMLRLGRPFVLFSGGRDSLCLLEYMRRLAKGLGKQVTALHADTTAGFPEVEAFVKRTCKALGVELVTVRPTRDYFDLAKSWGIPSFKSRWCCETLKIAPMRRYLASVDGPKVVFDGIRAAESNLRATYLPVWFHPSFRCISVSPLFGWSDEKVLSYLKTHDLPKSPVADLNTSAECWCGAYKTKGDFEALLKCHPDIFDKLIDVEKAQRGTFTFLYERGQQIPLRSLKKKR